MVFDDAKESMVGAIDRMEKELLKIRAGKANPSMLSTVNVEYYGSQTPLKNLANVTTPDAKTLMIQPFEKGIIEDIEKAIQKANLGFNPQNDGKLIRITIPALTEERRRDLVKMAKSVAEQAKVSIRNARKDANDMVKDLKKEGMSEDMAKGAEDSIQSFTNDYSEKVDRLVSAKEEDIMTI